MFGEDSWIQAEVLKGKVVSRIAGDVDKDVVGARVGETEQDINRIMSASMGRMILLILNILI